MPNKIYTLNEQSYKDSVSIPLLGIEYIKQDIDFSNYDGLIMTSKNAAYAVDSFSQDWKNVPCYVIAPKTAQIVKRLGADVVFTGNSGHGEEFAQELLSVLQNKKVLFLRAQKVVSNLFNILKNSDIDVEEVSVYRSVCNTIKDEFVIEDNSVVIFSSPSTVECFLKTFSWNSTCKAVAIGRTTAKYLPQDVHFELSNETSMASCIEKAKEILS